MRDKPSPEPVEQSHGRLVARIGVQHRVQCELVDPVLEVRTLLTHDDESEIAVLRRQRHDQSLRLLVIEYRPEEGDARLLRDTTHDRFRPEREEFARNHGEPLAEQGPKTGLVLGGAADQDVGGH
ncbi:hypothetical protein [Agromyces sp. NPDC058126]|uniref:hypothetical protein n=1 Tax=Agromyces sp. NPDC058126 TaxID=3346350 RepID=UPI0036D7D44E